MVRSVNAEALTEDVRKRAGVQSSSSEEVAANAVIAGGLEGWRACLPTPGGRTTNIEQIQEDMLCPDASNPSELW